ncbi:hypothetical protein ACYSNW_16170 [Enterococcus sp. LJL99]
MLKKNRDFKKTILSVQNQKYLKNNRKNFGKFGKPINRNPKNLLYSLDDKHINDFFTLFDKGKPDISFSTTLLELGEWQDYGTKLYRVNTTLSLADFSSILYQELEITKKEILITPAFTGIHGFYF